MRSLDGSMAYIHYKGLCNGLPKLLMGFGIRVVMGGGNLSVFGGWQLCLFLDQYMIPLLACPICASV